jgi:hypothetical protein
MMHPLANASKLPGERAFAVLCTKIPPTFQLPTPAAAVAELEAHFRPRIG